VPRPLRAGRNGRSVVAVRRKPLVLTGTALLGALAVFLAAAPPPPDPPAASAEAPDGAPAGEAPAQDHVLITIPDWLPFGGMTLGRHVFLKARQQVPWSLGHELVHVRQQRDHPVWFWVSYLALPSWRLRWEAEAYAVNARAGCPIDGEHGTAAYLAGPAYLWAGSRAEAAAEIRKYR